MKPTTQKAVRGLLISAVGLLATCTPNSLLTDVQEKVREAQATATQTVSSPIFSPTTGTYSADTSVTITESTPGAVIHYSTAAGGAIPPDPTSDSPVYDSPITVSGNGTIMTVKAMATKSGMLSSAVVTAIYTINYSQVSTPQISPSTSYSSGAPLAVTISTGTPGASIRYTTDGSTPTTAFGTLYSGLLYVTTTMKIMAIAFEPGLNESTVAFANFTFPDSAPTFSPSTGSYPGPQSVSITTTMPGASIRYTADGSMPSSTSGTLYVGPVSVAGSETLTAIAFESYWVSPPASAATYTLPVAAPVISPPAGEYHAPQTVSISTQTPQATIRYTTDGSIPTSTNGLLYSAPINIKCSQTIMARAFEPGWTDSSVTSEPLSIVYFAYVANLGSANVSAFTLDSGTGALSPVSGSPFAAGANPQAVATDPKGRFVYVANYGSGNVSAYAIDQSTGALSPISGSPFAAGANPWAIAVDPSGKYVYVTSEMDSTVSAYAINSSTGGLLPVSGSPFAFGFAPFGVAADPMGSYIYFTDGGSDKVRGYSINASTGALTALSGLPSTGYSPWSIAVDPTGSFVYVTNGGVSSNSISAYTININTGALSPVLGSPYGAGTAPKSVAVDPTGSFVYVANCNSTNVSAYKIYAGTGALSGVSGSPFTAGYGPEGVAADPSGKFLYVVNYAGTVSAYTIDSNTGALAAVSGSPFAAGTDSYAIAITAATGP